MQLTRARILLTGATGGLGEALARELAAAGAALLLTGRDAEKLARIELPAGCECQLLQADLTRAGDLDSLCQAARQFGVNVLINNAGIGGFGLLDAQDWPTVDQILSTNLATPIRLTQALLPQLREQPTARIVNIGSAFGSIPFAGFAAYSAAKAGLRAFSQALRRELADSSIRVLHVAPRAINTALNSPAVNALNVALGNASDPPGRVAQQVVRVLENDTRERVIGSPERLFAWLNAAFPALVDRGLKDKLATIKRFAASR